MTISISSRDILRHSAVSRQNVEEVLGTGKIPLVVRPEKVEHWPNVHLVLFDATSKSMLVVVDLKADLQPALFSLDEVIGIIVRAGMDPSGLNVPLQMDESVLVL